MPLDFSSPSGKNTRQSTFSTVAIYIKRLSGTSFNTKRATRVVDCVWNVMTHAQKPDFVFRRNRRVHLNRQGRQFSRLLAAEVCASAVVMLDIPCSEVVWRELATLSIHHFPFTSPPVGHRMPSHFNWTLQPSAQHGKRCTNTTHQLCYLFT